MRQRKLHIAHDGSCYSDKITLFLRVEDKELVFECDPDALYAIVHESMASMALAEKQAGPQDEQSELRKRIAKTLKNVLRGGLKVVGNDLLTILYRTKDHPKLPTLAQGEDPLDWYLDQFTLLGISHLLKQDTFMTGKEEVQDDAHTFYEIVSVVARPVAAPQSALDAVGTEY